MHICVIGLGYIGLPTAVVLAREGARVTGVDRSDNVLADVRAGRLHFVEPGLESVLKEVVDSGRLEVSDSPVEADVFIVAVPTPFTAEHRADLSIVEGAVRGLAATLGGGELVILESTSPPGTTERMRDWVADERPDLDVASVDFAHGPERVLPGRILEEIVKNDRIVGGVSKSAGERAREVYSIFCEGEILTTGARTAEAVKLVENSFRDVNIAFANELSLIADRLDIDVWEVIELANHHPRVNILAPGPGVGGHCIAVDPWFLAEMAPDLARIITTARMVNDEKPAHVLDLIERAGGAKAESIVLLGLAFKKNVDDLRGSPAMSIAQDVAQRYPDRVSVVEPHINDVPPEFAGKHLRLADLDAVKTADLVVLLVDHDVFGDVPSIAPESAVLIDTRGIWRRR